jgi:hypothetical protein
MRFGSAFKEGFRCYLEGEHYSLDEADCRRYVAPEPSCSSVLESVAGLLLAAPSRLDKKGDVLIGHEEPVLGVLNSVIALRAHKDVVVLGEVDDPPVWGCPPAQEPQLEGLQPKWIVAVEDAEFFGALS